MLKNTPKYLSKSISDAGWGKFLEYLKYKAKNIGKIILEAAINLLKYYFKGHRELH